MSPSLVKKVNFELARAFLKHYQTVHRSVNILLLVQDAGWPLGAFRYKMKIVQNMVNNKTESILSTKIVIKRNIL